MPPPGPWPLQQPWQTGARSEIKQCFLLRLSISKGEQIELSGQFMLACDSKQSNCKGGSVAAAWGFLRSTGFGYQKSACLKLIL